VDVASVVPDVALLVVLLLAIGAGHQEEVVVVQLIGHVVGNEHDVGHGVVLVVDNPALTVAHSGHAVVADVGGVVIGVHEHGVAVHIVGIVIVSGIFLHHAGAAVLDLHLVHLNGPELMIVSLGRAQVIGVAAAAVLVHALAQLLLVSVVASNSIGIV